MTSLYPHSVILHAGSLIYQIPRLLLIKIPHQHLVIYPLNFSIDFRHIGGKKGHFVGAFYVDVTQARRIVFNRSHALRGNAVKTFQRPLSPNIYLQQSLLPRRITRTRITPMFRQVDITALYRIGMDIIELLPHHGLAKYC